MPIIHGFERLGRREVPELKITGEWFRHIATGAELVSVTGQGEDKAFGINFHTPPYDSAGMPHILEHCVLSGSRKYPVKSPFMELMKGSLQSFMNAFTYADFTTYISVTRHREDFYNLLRVYLDSVLHPLLSTETFRSEAWRYHLDEATQSLSYKGVVLSEMKGTSASPDTHLARRSAELLFPDTPYRFNSGGDPNEIVELTHDRLTDFHRRYYHPSNARVYFYGDNDVRDGFRIIDSYFKAFKKQDIRSAVPMQTLYNDPRRKVCFFPVGTASKKTPQSMVTINWALCPAYDWETLIALSILEHILVGTPGAPLRKALLDSKLGESLVGGGYNTDLRQTFFALGLKGIQAENDRELETLVFETLSKLAEDGIPHEMVEAAVNKIEFIFREPASKPFPQVLQLMIRTLSAWLSNKNPLGPLEFEAPLSNIKAKIHRDEGYFEELIRRYFLENTHRLHLVMKPDPGLAEKEKKTEQKRLASAYAQMTEDQLESIRTTAKKLKEIQETPDPPEVLAAIPRLTVAQLDKSDRAIPLLNYTCKGTQILYHDFYTNGIVYLTLGFNLHRLPEAYLPYARLFARALLEMGTETADHIELNHRISGTTGGIRPGYLNSAVKDSEESASWLFLQGKAMTARIDDLLDIFTDILLHARLDQPERFRQILVEEKARHQRKLSSMGHQVVLTRLTAHFSEAGWAGEQMNGVSYIFFLRELIRKIDTHWPAVLVVLEEMRGLLIDRNTMLANITLDEIAWRKVQPKVENFIGILPVQHTGNRQWQPGTVPLSEGLVIPSPVNYVGKSVNIYKWGYRFHGSAFVISRYLRTTWLWQQVRVQGGAYEGYCYFDRLAGAFSLVSVRDPNITKTIETFDRTAHFLKNLTLDKDELERSLIGVIGEFDRSKLPGALGYTSMMRYLTGVTGQERQRIREEVLSTQSRHFNAFGDRLEGFAGSRCIKVLGSEPALRQAMTGGPGTGLEILGVL